VLGALPGGENASQSDLAHLYLFQERFLLLEMDSLFKLAKDCLDSDFTCPLCNNSLKTVPLGLSVPDDAHSDEHTSKSSSEKLLLGEGSSHSSYLVGGSLLTRVERERSYTFLD